MNDSSKRVNELKQKLQVGGIWPFKLMGQRKAMAGLLASNDLAATDVLAEAVDTSHGLSRMIRTALAASTDAARIDRLCQHWASKRAVWLGAIIKSQGWTGATDGVSALCALKAGLAGQLGLDHATAGAVLEYLLDADADVRQGVHAYVARLPDSADVNDRLFDTWIRTGSQELEKLLVTQKRLPGSLPKETLLLLATGQVKRYLELGDEKGDYLREAYAIATPALQTRINETVMQARDRKLLDAYERARAAAGALDPAMLIKARQTAGDEDGVITAAKNYGVLQMLEICERWAASKSRPTDPARRRAVERAVAAFQRIGKVEFEAPPKLPDGLVDFFEWTEKENSKTDDKTVATHVKDEDPFVRTGAAWVLHRRGKLPAADAQRLAKSEDWPERLVARLANPALAASGAGQEHVEWTGLAGGVIAPLLFTATATGTPAEHEELLAIYEANKKAGDEGGKLNAALAEILIAFQSYFQAGGITVGDDDSAGRKEDVKVGADVGAEELKF
jgi:hypothetical protein